MVGRFGGFADKVRCHAAWAIPLPDGVDAAKAGPLFCGGITVFNPIVQFDVKPTDRVGVIGIGGLGHLAVQFLNKWGCDVVAFTSSELGCLPCCACAQGAAARCRSGPGVDSRKRVCDPGWTEIDFGLAPRQPADNGEDARVLRAAQDRRGHRAVADVEG